MSLQFYDIDSVVPCKVVILYMRIFWQVASLIPLV